MIYMVAGYLIIWLCSFGFIISMVQRQRSIQRQLDTLKEVTQETQPAPVGQVNRVQG